jgi:hypothetical protein
MEAKTGDFVVTREWILDYRTQAGAWTSKQLTLIGVSWPPVAGWIRRSVGLKISAEAKAAFESYGVKQTDLFR